MLSEWGMSDTPQLRDGWQSLRSKTLFHQVSVAQARNLSSGRGTRFCSCALADGAGRLSSSVRNCVCVCVCVSVKVWFRACFFVKLGHAVNFQSSWPIMCKQRMPCLHSLKLLCCSHAAIAQAQPFFPFEGVPGKPCPLSILVRPSQDTAVWKAEAKQALKNVVP